MRFSLIKPDLSSSFPTARKYTVKTGADDDDKTTIRVEVFEDGPLEAALQWRIQLEDLFAIKKLSAEAKFTNAALTLTGNAKSKWTLSLPSPVSTTEPALKKAMAAFML